MKKRTLLGLSACSAAVAALSLSAPAQTGYEWGHEFDTPSLLPYGDIEASAIYDDGTGPALYLAGLFWEINGEGAFAVVRFDGTDWSPLGGGLHDQYNSARVRTLEVFDPDGPGPQKEVLVAGGEFHTANGFSTPVNNVAMWDGTIWTSPANGISGILPQTSWPDVQDLKSFDDGTGPKLYACGMFTVGGLTGMAVWDGQTWSNIGYTGTVGGWPVAMEVYDDGNGPALYFGGNFNAVIGTANTDGIARWDGSNWSSLGANFTEVQGFTTFDADGAGPLPEKLITSNWGSLQVWDGTTLSNVSGWGAPLTPALAVFDDGTGPAVYVGCNDGLTPDGNRMRKWDGVSSSMVPVGSPVEGVFSVAFMNELVVYQGELYAGGIFNGTAAAPSRGLLKWDGSDWVDPIPRKGLGGFNPAVGAPSGQSTYPYGAVSFDAGNGAELFIGGIIPRAGDAIINSGLAAWNGTSWRDAGPVTTPGFAEYSTPLGIWDDGSGSALFVGLKESATGVNKVFKLGSGGWSEVGAASAAFGGRVYRMAIFDDGTGAAAYVIDGKSVHKWDGLAWTLMGTIGTTNSLRAMAVFNGGSGDELYVGGFGHVAGATGFGIAKFDGTNWSSVGSGMSNGGVTSMYLMDDGSGTALYAGGTFSSASGVSGTAGIARWDGSSWSALGSGVVGVEALLGTHDDGTIERLYVSTYNPSLAEWGASVHAWDGTQWTMVPDSFTPGYHFGMLDYDDGLGAGAYIWGDFRGTGGKVVNIESTIDTANQSGYIVRWGLPYSPLSVSGTGCSLYSSDIPQIQGGGLAQIGTSSFVTSVKNVPAGLPAALIIGTDTNFWLGIPLPIDLAAMGWAGCNLYQSWDFTFWTVTGGVGTTGGVASLPLVIPSQSSLVGLNLGMQWAVISPALAGIDIGVTPLGEVVIE